MSTTARNREEETKFQRAFYSALGDRVGVALLKDLSAKNPALASQFKPLFLDIANANLKHLKTNPNREEETVIKELVVYLETLPTPTGGRRLRLNVERRRTQRNRGGRKYRKLRKLTTRRR